ncbi:hypothetical protein ACI68E_001896 [Malassezia pachydermatis]|uniref:Uncharacterized protein n=1 Tax=Malassezia pachydermatis TaxID=77020 RepID=A0A0M8MN64_9BASI|nr:hypothetical protein Malapachy_1262 [Malassezia pachydermatis]KOS14948.1 hypothetical protein Malapachy_1262 [Malassezia pachydermatis]
MAYNTPLVGGLYPICTEDVYKAYHDPSVHIFLTIVFGIFTLVFLYYLCVRRPKFEYAMMLIFCALQVGAFAMRIYSDIQDAFIGIMVYSAAISISLGVMYSLYVRWTKIADKYFGTKMFDRGFGSYIAIAIITIIVLALIVASVWVASTIWVVFLVLFAILWVGSIVTLIIHQRHRPPTREVPIVMSLMDRVYNLPPIATSHQQLYNMQVFIIVLNTILLVKQIFLTICFVLVPLFFITPLYYIFCIIPDLAFAVMISNSEALPLFEPARHMPSVRTEILERERTERMMQTEPMRPTFDGQPVLMEGAPVLRPEQPHGQVVPVQYVQRAPYAEPEETIVQVDAR